MPVTERDVNGEAGQSPRPLGQRVRNFRKRQGTGEKTGRKLMAQTGCVFDLTVPDRPPRTLAQIIRQGPGHHKNAPAAVKRLVRHRHHRRPLGDPEQLVP